ncbi:MAG: hypothetical protein HN366_27770, partial [Deltaproteobacteria bacterium]|nr:hypothetical protein [Deltaproteobacteria bacterium]
MVSPLIAETLTTILDADYVNILDKINNVTEEQIYVMLVDYVSVEDAQEIERIKLALEEENAEKTGEGLRSLAGLH